MRRIPLDLLDKRRVEGDRVKDDRSLIVSGAEAFDKAGRAGRRGGAAKREHAPGYAEFLGGG